MPGITRADQPSRPTANEFDGSVDVTQGPPTSLAEGLTPSQWQAVDHFEGPLLVLAGPGSGKTRVITRRIARLVERGVPPHRILAITFTNKAAREMAARVEILLPGQRVWVSTFHRFCARLLRRYGEAVGLSPGFTIYDTSDQHQVIRRVLEDHGVPAVTYPASKVAALISREKNNLVTAEEYLRGYQESIADHQSAVVSRVFPEYQKALLAANAVDFDDLLLHVVTLLRDNPELRAELDARFEFVLVDEYQDTNRVQYELVKALSHNFPNLCVTGDPDQSIYSWRGARIANILRFEADFPRARVVRLEENFRSTGGILRAADALIAHNVHRKQKSLVTANPDGEPVELLRFADAEHEADWIAREIRRQVGEEERRWTDFAVFYRVNALSRTIESAFRRNKVPYQVAAGFAFFERAEVKDLLAYLRLVQNPRDDVAFLRTVNTPARGIGKATIAKLSAAAAARGASLLDAASHAHDLPDLSKRAAAALEAFAAMIGRLALYEDASVEALLRRSLEESGYERHLREDQSEQAAQRQANVGELITAAVQYDAAAGDERSLEGFLESTSLASDTDGLAEDAGQVTLMTLHAAKGLEYPVVFVLGLEEGLLPHERAVRTHDEHDLEEERRLLFVGITRAQERLYLTHAAYRAIRGNLQQTIPSSFQREIRLVVRDLAVSEPGPADVSFPSADPFDVTDDEAAAFEAQPRRLRRSAPIVGTGAASRPVHPSQMMTAADLLRRREADTPRPMFRVGMSVRHPRYGIGAVTQLSEGGRWQTVTVRFAHEDREEQFVADKAPLQPIGIEQPNDPTTE